MMIHVTNGTTEGSILSTDLTPFEWNVFNLYLSISQFGVAMFVMISGALFLSRDIPIRRIYSRNIFRMFTAFVFWSFIFAFRGYMKNGDALKALSAFVHGEPHMWFMFMITGLYMMIPFLKKITESETLTKYFLVLSLVFAFIVPSTAKIVGIFSEHYGDAVKQLSGRLSIGFVTGFSGYFVLGYVLSNAEISPKAERVIYLAGIVSTIAAIFLTSWASRFIGKTSFAFFGSLTVNVLLQTTALFVFFVKHCERESKIIRKLSQYAFGAYLVHWKVQPLLYNRLGITQTMFHPLIAVPFTTAMVFLVSFAISAVVNHIPVLKKYVV